MKVIKKILIALLLIIIFLFAGIYFYLKSGLPEYSGQMKLTGLKEEVKVYFDPHAIPHIYAANAEDAYMALGYLHAQERLFQMEMGRRMASGRMSELLGPDLLNVDIFFRTLGIRRQARKSAVRFKAKAKPEAVKAAEAYLAGINRFIDEGPTPIEFKMLKIEKEHFDLTDVFSILGYTVLGFSNATGQEPVITRLWKKYGKQYLKDWDLDVDFPSPDSITVPEDMVLQETYRDLWKLAPYPIRFGSNAWVISPQKSASGKVIFANDTHIFFAQPSTWFEAYIEYPGMKFYGNYLAGVPFGMIGHNPYLAWGLTIFPTDNMDMYYEKINPADKEEAWVNDHWEKMEIVEETIKIKEHNDTTLTVKITRHGPLINHIMKNNPDASKPVSLRWVYLEMPSLMLDAVYDMARAENIDEMKAAVRMIDVLGLNVLYGDTDGNIAWWACGKVSKRPPHVNSKIILDGASGEDELIGYLDFEENPHEINPERGYIVSANHRPDPVNGFDFPGYYTPDIRAKRIDKLLSNMEKVSMDDVKRMHRDVLSDADFALSQNFVSTLAGNGYEGFKKQGLEVLEEWDGNYTLDSRGSIIYTKLQYYMLLYGLKDELGEDDFNALLNSYLIKRSIPGLFINDQSLWWDDINTPEKETRKDILTKAYDQSMKDLELQLGTDFEKWRWGDVHTLTHVHPIGRKAPFDKIFNVGPFPDPGSNAVMNKQAFLLNGTGHYKAFLGPALRIIHDFSQPGNSLSINPTGQSGHFNSNYYSDQAALYNAGKYRKQMTDKDEVLATAIGELTLSP